ncbi:hypothetical protein WOLCODRAFT_150858 [Wolfiporia cocos MD-104 SS10]|uniref:SET domain-containing protein n=1 Tax=Wolfiporia cocos (strain MD-104) TaxID=742152 RepID=A0A2H3JF31_WOLCO|nr:hypothetical protein WOLCODRAFT_150858 [Wolfiporia cocos MD-104 SS10]
MIISSRDKRGDPLPLHSLRKIEETISSFYKTAKSPIRPEMFFIRSYIANRLQSTLASREAIKQYTKALGDLGFVVIRSDSGPSRSQSSTNKKPKQTLPIRTHYRHSLAPMEWTVPVMLRISQQYFRLNDQHNSSQWLKAALWGRSATSGNVGVLAEDPAGTTLNLAIHNYPTTFDAFAGDLDSLFPIGTVMAIREPHLRAGFRATHALVRVDSPSNIVFFGSDGYFMPNKMKGHASKAKRRLDNSDPEIEKHSSKGVLADAGEVRKRAPTASLLHDRALLMEAQAEYGMGNWENALQRFKEWQLSHPPSRDVAVWTEQAQGRLGEQQSGSYDWVAIFQDSHNNSRIDVADYTGPIEVRRLRGRERGRGIVATRDTAVGELLLVSKAFVQVSYKEIPKFQKAEVFNVSMHRHFSPSQYALLPMLLQKLYGNPNLYPAVLNLYAGPRYQDLAPPQYNFSVPAEPIPVDPFDVKVNLDVDMLESICLHNWLEPTPLRHYKSSSLDGEDPRWDTTALFLYPSIFNHSCMPNARWTCIGDIMIIRATENIEAGTEITLPFASGLDSYTQRNERLQQHLQKLPTECDCRLCRMDRADSFFARTRRQNLVHMIRSDSRVQTLPFERLRMIERDLSSTYTKSRGLVRPEMSYIHELIARRKRDVNAFEDAIEEYKRALACLGFVLGEDERNRGRQPRPSNEKGPEILPISAGSVPSVAPIAHSIPMMLAIAQCYRSLNDRHNSSRWLRAAQWVSDMTVGGGKQLFMLVWVDLLKKLNLQGLAENVL